MDTRLSKQQQQHKDTFKVVQVTITSLVFYLVLLKWKHSLIANCPAFSKMLPKMCWILLKLCTPIRPSKCIRIRWKNQLKKRLKIDWSWTDLVVMYLHIKDPLSWMSFCNKNFILFHKRSNLIFKFIKGLRVKFLIDWCKNKSNGHSFSTGQTKRVLLSSFCD